MTQPDSELRANDSVLKAIVKAHSLFSESRSARQVFEELLRVLLEVTSSDYGFIGEILQEESGPCLQAYAITNIAWSDETQAFYEKNIANGLKFKNLDTLFGHTIRTGEAVIANEPDKHPSSRGVPKGHPPLRHYLGLPFHHRGEMVGMVGIANRPEGYSQDEVDLLAPLLQTCGTIIALIRTEQENSLAKQTLENSNQELRFAQERFRTIFDDAVDPMVVIDDDGIVQECNGAFENTFGYSVSDVVGRNVAMLMPTPHRDSHDQYIRDYLDTGVSKVIGIGREVRALRKDGSTFPADLSVAEVRLADGRRIFAGTLRDVSAKKLAERQQAHLTRQLQSSQRALETVLDELAVSAMIIDADDRVLYFKPHGAARLWPHAQESTGRPCVEVLPGHDTACAELLEQAQAAPSQRSEVLLSWEASRGEQRQTTVKVLDDPRDATHHILLMRDATEVHQLRIRAAEADLGRIVCGSAAMRSVVDQIRLFAASSWPVLVDGETGVGKEMVARAIHSASDRREGPFVPVNCGGLTESLLQSQLFGQRKGSFTGALEQEGVFQAADHGTLLLDEVADLPLSLQAAVLRALQEGEILRVGDTKSLQVDARVIAVTNKDLNALARAGAFRDDLLYRLRVGRIRVPPLRERRDDIPLLVSSFLAEACFQRGVAMPRVTAAATQRIIEYEWPGNVRELRACVQYAVMAAKNGVIDERDLAPELLQERDTSTPAPKISPPHMDTADAPSEAEDEKTRILKAIEWAEGNRARAARRLGMSTPTFYRRLKRYGIPTKRPQQ